MTQNQIRLKYLESLGWKVENLGVDPVDRCEVFLVAAKEESKISYLLRMCGNKNFEVDSYVVKSLIEKYFCPFCQIPTVIKRDYKLTCYSCNATDYEFSNIDWSKFSKEEQESHWLKAESKPVYQLIEDDVPF